MSKVTSKLGLILPGGGSTGLNMPPDRVDIDVLNDNFTKIDNAVADLDTRVGVDTGPTALTLQNGWVNFSNTAYQTMQSRRVGKVVSVDGSMQGGTVSPGTLLFTLPIGSRPLKYIVRTVWSNGQARPVEIAPDGKVVVGDTALSVARTDIGFVFIAEQ